MGLAFTQAAYDCGACGSGAVDRAGPGPAAVVEAGLLSRGEMVLADADQGRSGGFCCSTLARLGDRSPPSGSGPDRCSASHTGQIRNHAHPLPPQPSASVPGNPEGSAWLGLDAGASPSPPGAVRIHPRSFYAPWRGSSARLRSPPKAPGADRGCLPTGLLRTHRGRQRSPRGEECAGGHVPGKVQCPHCRRQLSRWRNSPGVASRRRCGQLMRLHTHLSLPASRAPPGERPGRACPGASPRRRAGGVRPQTRAVCLVPPARPRGPKPARPRARSGQPGVPATRRGAPPPPPPLGKRGFAGLQPQPNPGRGLPEPALGWAFWTLRAGKSGRWKERA